MKRYLLISFTLISFLFLSCDDEKHAKIEVWLTDAPGDFQEVKIDLQAVEIHANENDNESGWKSMEISQGIYDLLELTNGRDTLLGNLTLPAGKISQIRLKLGVNNTVKVNDQSFMLSTPSAQQSGLKLQVHEVLKEGITYKILLDFDAAKSVVETGNGAYSLKPVIRTITKAQDGAIRGVVNPVGTPVSISAILGDETVATTYSDNMGNFLLRGLETGTYRVVFDAGADYPMIEKTNVTVEMGIVSDLGVVEITE